MLLFAGKANPFFEIFSVSLHLIILHKISFATLETVSLVTILFLEIKDTSFCNRFFSESFNRKQLNNR